MTNTAQRGFLSCVFLLATVTGVQAQAGLSIEQVKEGLYIVVGSGGNVETEHVSRLLQEVAPSARTLLDVGCGTGEHALRLHSGYGYDVSGLDIEPAFVDSL